MSYNYVVELLNFIKIIFGEILGFLAELKFNGGLIVVLGESNNTRRKWIAFVVVAGSKATKVRYLRILTRLKMFYKNNELLYF